MPIIRDERFKEEVVEAYLEGTLIRDIVSKTYYSAIRSKKTFDDLQKLGVSCSRPDAFTLPTGLILSKELEIAYVQGWKDAGGR